MDIASGHTTDAICRYVRYTSVYPRALRSRSLYLSVSCDSPLATSLAIPPCETVCSRWKPRNHVSRPQLLLFPNLFSRSLPLSLCGAAFLHPTWKELFMINLLADGWAIYLPSAQHPEILSIKLNHFHSDGTHVLRNCDFLIIAAMHRLCDPIQAPV